MGEDIFSLGSLIYFIMTDMYPYEEVPSDQVVARYRRHEFPELSYISGGHVIRRCLEGQVGSAQEVVSELSTLET